MCDKFTLNWLRGSVLKIKIHENAYLQLSDLYELQRHKIQLTRNEPHAILYISPQLGNLSREGREFAASKEASLNTIAKAVVTANLGMRILVGLYITVNKPVLPHRSFANEEDALQWLHEMLAAKGIKQA